MDFKYIVVQAGGKGTRMEHLTRNKPKALVPIDNLPMLFHLFHLYADKKFIIIGDYKISILEKYLSAFAVVDYTIVNASGHKGTCAGVWDAAKYIPDNSPFMLIWSDLILNADFDLTGLNMDNYIGLSYGFECRWKYQNQIFSEERSSTDGVAGLFIFKNKALLQNIPSDGEFVHWLSKKKISFNTIRLDKTKEYGLIASYRKIPVTKCRPFNKITIAGDMIIKEALDEQGDALAKRESAWYKAVMDKGIESIPKVYHLKPLTMERIKGDNVYAYADIDIAKKKKILIDIIGCLKTIHQLGSCPYDEVSFREAYFGKTYKRLEKVRELVPFAKNEYIKINQKKCRNIFYRKNEVEQLLMKYKPNRFVFIHGDCTFSNILFRNGKEPVLIDPRGYFGNSELYGDPAYDWAKLYYSLVGNYDQFNLKRFRLEINEVDVQLDVQSTNWEMLEQFFFEAICDEVVPAQIKIIHGIIWLSLTTYAWEDYDSICGAFYRGLYYLEDALDSI